MLDVKDAFHDAVNKFSVDNWRSYGNQTEKLMEEENLLT